VGDTVLDPFIGCGTLVAAAGCGRRGICIEIEERYCALARVRIEKAASTARSREPDIFTEA
jgi:site-specific DNA-methyltransferase (adenine-specific)